MGIFLYNFAAAATSYIQSARIISQKASLYNHDVAVIRKVDDIEDE